MSRTNLEEIKAKLQERMKAMENKNSKVSTPKISKPQAKRVTENQVKTYFKLCGDKRQQINPSFRDLGFAGLDKEIKRLIKLPTVKAPSESQINMVREICDRNNWEYPDMKDLTGGREGTMSVLINDLVELEKESRSVAPLTDEQVEIIMSMYFCPDIDFAELNENWGIHYEMVGDKPFYTRVDQEDILKEIKDVITFREANDFIYNNQTTYYEWRKTRVSVGQMNIIRKLQERCGMIPMKEHQLLQFSNKGAESYIKNLQIDLRRFKEGFLSYSVEEYATGGTIADLITAQRTYQEKYEDLSDNRPIHDNKNGKLQDKHLQEVDNLLYGLYAMMGMSGRDESQYGIDLSNGEDTIRDLAQTVAEITGTDSVYSILLTVYSPEEALEILNAEVKVEKKEEKKEVKNSSKDELEEIIEMIRKLDIKDIRLLAKDYHINLGNSKKIETIIKKFRKQFVSA